jgi:hypothetical protein
MRPTVMKIKFIAIFSLNGEKGYMLRQRNMAEK